MNRFLAISFVLLHLAIGCKKSAETKTEFVDNKFTDFPYSSHFSVVTFNSDTVSFKVGEDQRYPLLDSIDFSKTIDVKMYYPIKSYIVNGKDVLQGEREMYLMFGQDIIIEEPFNKSIDKVLFDERLTVKNDTGYLKFNLSDKLDLSLYDSINWRASIYTYDTGFIEYGKFYLKK